MLSMIIFILLIDVAKNNFFYLKIIIFKLILNYRYTSLVSVLIAESLYHKYNY